MNDNRDEPAPLDALVDPEPQELRRSERIAGAPAKNDSDIEMEEEDEGTGLGLIQEFTNRFITEQA